MKRLLTLLLVVLVCLGCMTLVACGNNDNNTDTDTGSTPAGPSNLDNAIEYVFTMYNSGLGDEAAKLEKDLTVIASVIVENDSFNVEWSVEVTKGAADAVKVVDGANNTKTIDIPDYNDEQIEFTLKATVKGADGKTGDVSFKYYIPVRVKQEIDSAKKIVLQFKDGDTTKYITGKHYLYTSSSGSQKWELELTEVLAEALAITVVENDDNTVSFVAEGKYLFCDATNVKFVDTQDDNTKFVLEPTSNGVFIKCAVANFNGKAQYLEVYKGYLTCYSMNESSDPAIFTFSFVDADNTVAGTIVIPDNTDKPGSGDDTTGGDDKPTTGTPVLEAETPAVNTAYKLAFVQGNLNKAFYLTGAMSSFYMASTENFAEAVDFYIEATDGGYYLYCMVDGAKKYVNIAAAMGTDGKEHINATYDDSAASVYTYDETLKTFVTKVNDTDYILGTRNDKEYSTLGPMKTDSGCFNAVLVTKAATVVEGGDDNTGDDNTGDDNTGDGNIVDNIADTIFIQFADDAGTIKYVTGKEYLYTSASSGNQKIELELSENIAEALAFTVQNNADNTISFVANEKYLFCDGNNVKLADTEDDYTKFELEATTNGFFIKCAVANFNGKAQYLEVYGGYLTCYGMNESNASIYTFALIEANTTGGDDNTGDDNTGDDNTGDDNTGDVIPEKIVIEFVDGDTTKYITGKHYLYTSSSGSEKWELELTENLADALAITVQKNDDNTISFVAEGKYLFCNGTDVKFVDTQDDNTKFVIEDSTNGKFIKCAVANFNGKAQYLEVYSGYLTCYSMNESKANIYTFSLVEADESAAGTIVIPEPHVCTVFNDATCTTPKTCTECGATVGSALGHSYANGVCSVCGANEPTVDGTSVTASKTVADLITEYGWTNSTTKQSFNLDDNVSVKVNGGSNSGKAYNGDHIRIYATDSPAGTLTISVADGYELVSVKVTTLTGTYAFLYVDGSTTDISNQSVEVSGTSVVLNTVMNGTDGKQVRVTAIEVVYKEA